jgi:hypothetical protein
VDHSHHQGYAHMWNTQPVGRLRRSEAATQAGPQARHSPEAACPDAGGRGQAERQRDAATILTRTVHQYGLGSLAGQITGFIQQGYSADAISILLQNTPEYKQRFAANDARLKKGLPALSPAEYIATERSYRQVMSAAGLPLGFYDQTSDFQKFLENDMSPTELKSRVDTAAQAVNQAPSESQGLLPAVVQHGRHDCLRARPQQGRAAG